MKLILLAATAMIAVPAIAQTTTPDTDTSTQTTSPTDQSTTQTPTDQSTMQSPSTTDQSMAPTDQSTMQTPPADTSGAAPMQGAAAPGGPVTVQPSMSPSQAFPPPPAQTGPLPFCKAGQYDKCREHSTPSGARSHRTPR